MIEELKQKLGEEVEKLHHELNVVLPNEIRKAVELGDLRENSEYKAALERQQLVQARLGQLRQRLSKLSSIDPSQIPTDKVGLGSKVVVEDQRTSDRETNHTAANDHDVRAFFHHGSSPLRGHRRRSLEVSTDCRRNRLTP